jgi:hypothetical protein
MPGGEILARASAPGEAAAAARIIAPIAANATRARTDVDTIEAPRGDAPWERLQLITNGVDTSHGRSWIRPKPAAAADAKEFLTSRKKSRF